MDQKNTIVKCKAASKCLWGYIGMCDNYVINIDENGRCISYTECENPEKINITVTSDKKRGQRAKCDFIQDGVPQEIVDEVLGVLEYYSTTRLQGHLGMCMWCDYHRSNCGCAHKNPDIDEEKRECYSIKSTGANR